MAKMKKAAPNPASQQAALTASSFSLWFPMIPVAIAAFALIPTIYFFAQTGDGWELVVTALKGGILHPPGFPLQAWVDKFFIQFPLRTPDVRISIVSYLSHLGAVYFIADSLRRLGSAFAFQALGSLAFAFFLPMWILGVQPEVFALTHFLIALFLWYALKLSLAAPAVVPKIREAIVLGVIFGLCVSQHLITATLSVPFFAILTLMFKAYGVKVPLASVGASVLVILGFYSSLPLFATDALTVSWGDLSTPLKVFQHAIRLEYGVGSLSAVAGTEFHTGIGLFAKMLFKQWHLFLVPLFFGISFVAKSTSFSRYVKAVLFGQLIMGLILLLRAQMTDEQIISEYVLMRFQGPAIIVAAIFLALGLEKLMKNRFPRIGSRAAVAAVMAFIAVLYAVNFPSVKPPKGDVLDRYMQAVRMSLPEDTVYISSSDVECFKGITTAEGVRYPIETGILDAEWYFKKVLPRQEPRIKWSKHTAPTIKSIIDDATRAGLKVASTNAKLLMEYGSLELHGIVYILTPASSSSVRGDSFNVSATARSLAKAKEICSLLVTAEEVTKSHATPRVLLSSMYVAFEGAAGYLQLIRQVEAAKPYKEIAGALKEGSPQSVWQSNCQKIATSGF